MWTSYALSKAGGSLEHMAGHWSPGAPQLQRLGWLVSHGGQSSLHLLKLAPGKSLASGAWSICVPVGSSCLMKGKGHVMRRLEAWLLTC